MLPLITICFLLISIWATSLQAEEQTQVQTEENTLQAEEISPASIFNGGGEISLTWDHNLLATGTLIFSEVNSYADIAEGGAAIADAVAESFLDYSNSGEVRTTVALDGIVSGSFALAHSKAKAHNFFLLQNTSNEVVTVNFNWSAEWLVSGVIDQPETDRSTMGLQLTLAKTRLIYGNHWANMFMARALKDNMGVNWRFGRLLHGEIFSKNVTVHLPEEGFENYQSGGVSNEFEVTFGPRQTYLFGLTANVKGLATVSIEGCSYKFWRQNIRDWPISPFTRFSDVFGFGPEDMTLWFALVFPQAKVNEPRFFRNAVAALLNAESPRVSYYTDDPDYVKTFVKSTFESGDLEELEEITDDLVFHNNLGASDMCSSSLL